MKRTRTITLNVADILVDHNPGTGRLTMVFDVQPLPDIDIAVSNIATTLEDNTGMSRQQVNVVKHEIIKSIDDALILKTLRDRITDDVPV